MSSTPLSVFKKYTNLILTAISHIFAGKVVHSVQVVCDSQNWYRLEKGVVRCEQIGDCLVDHVPGKCMIQSLYSETSLRAKTFCKSLNYLDNNY
jgi:hypothetical protein